MALAETRTSGAQTDEKKLQKATPFFNLKKENLTQSP
jgi:hypothetical protein